MIRLVIRNIVRSSSSNNKIPKPRDPTVEESFQTKLSEDQMKIMIDPKGFMTEEEKKMEQENVVKAGEVKEEEDQWKGAKQVKMEKEYGFKPKGPEPTRYGDWEIKGKCVDF